MGESDWVVVDGRAGDIVAELRARVADLDARLAERIEQVMDLERERDHAIEHCGRASVRAEQAEDRAERAERERDKALTNRDGWAARSRDQFDRIGKALQSTRQKRASGAPARSDAEEIEEMVRRIASLERECDQLYGDAKRAAQRGDNWRT